MSEITDLIQLWKSDKAAVLQVLQQNEKLRTAFLELDDIWRASEQVTASGFSIWYKEQYQRSLPTIFHDVAEEFAWAFRNRKGVLLEGWRGMGKSTFFAAWCPYVMGVNPVGSTALIRINDAKAKEMGKAISDIIMTNSAWKKMFGHVLPDTQAGWSVENGFEVLDLKIAGNPSSDKFSDGYAKWRMMCLANHLSEKSLVCNGIESGSNIGLHPTNGMWFDDLHDEANTRSPAELKKVTDIIEGNIKPTWFSAGGSPTLGVFCTPWSENPPDAYKIMLATGLFKHIKKPIFEENETGEQIPPSMEFETEKGKEIYTVPQEYAGKKVRLAWPEAFPISKIVEMMRTYKTRFGQMCLLRLDLSKPKNMRYQTFPANDIKWNEWRMVLGVDPVGTVKGVSTGDGISHFAACMLLKSPYNSLIIGDGFVEKIDALEGERRVAETQRTYQRTYDNASVELNGAGAMWVAMISRTSGIKYHGHNVSEIGTGSKKERQYRFLQPLFASGLVLVSDGQTDFLDKVREYLDNFPNFATDSELWDVGDAIANGVLDIPQIWTKVVVDTAANDIFKQAQRQRNPWDVVMEGRR